MVALGDRDVGRAGGRRAEFAPAARVYADLREMLAAEAPDVVDILTPPAAHRDHCLAARGPGVHVICQKPPCDTLAGADRLVAAFDAYPKMFAAHENHRYRPWVRTVLRLAREGFFGTVHFVRLEHHRPAGPAHRSLSAETGLRAEAGAEHPRQERLRAGAGGAVGRPVGDAAAPRPAGIAPEPSTPGRRPGPPTRRVTPG